MYIPFDQLPGDSRIWIYQADREIKEDEIEQVNTACRHFADQWTAHQRNLQASFSVQFNRFLILGVNENIHGASGCSIDSSVRFVQNLGSGLNINFLDRRVALNKGGQLELLSLNEIKMSVSEGKITRKDRYFNHLIQTKGELDDSWNLPVTQGWMSRYFKERKEIVN